MESQVAVVRELQGSPGGLKRVPARERHDRSAPHLEPGATVHKWDKEKHIASVQQGEGTAPCPAVRPCLGLWRPVGSAQPPAAASEAAIPYVPLHCACAPQACLLSTWQLATTPPARALKMVSPSERVGPAACRDSRKTVVFLRNCALVLSVD